ncbi:MAG TPA: DsbA family protein [Solirubrobacteraceae bacterium]|jgi:protein-disulfide isomerase|nr:DsbA family protein [Solirubrobacteraceae bacterium]
MPQVGNDEEDLTRKERREQARAQRKAVEEAEAARAVRRTRMTQLGIVVAIVVVAIVVIAVAAGGGGSSNHTVQKGSAREASTVSKVNAEIGGISQRGNVLGAATAPVTLVYFGDLECPVCREFTLTALPSLIQKYVRTGKLRVEYRSLETATREPETFKTQQIAALAAGAQNVMWNFIELFYNEQGQEDSGYVTEGYLSNLANQTTGLNKAKWEEDRHNPAYENAVTTDAQLANSNKFNGTPAFLIGRTGGKLQKLEEVSPSEASGFESAIESLLKK